ncbi:MAG: hypothetical protein H7321_07330 [Bacteroidia bacterium]|nr:hypothetical protein [Bacteroidia bacterium]
MIRKILIQSLIVAVTLLTAICSYGQKQAIQVYSSRNIFTFNFMFGQQFPLADLKERFGSCPTVGVSVAYKTPSNWQFEAGLSSFYGSRVKENTMFDSLTGPSGDLIDANGQLAVIRLYERGFHVFAGGGRLFNFGNNNQNSGLLLTGGLGFMQHKIKFTYFKDILPQLDKDMYKGYDRLTNGLMLRQWVGYQRMDPHQRFNFFVGFEILEGFTKNRRSLNYDTRVRDNRNRLDMTLSFKVGISIALYGNMGKKNKVLEEKFFD